MSLTNLLGAAAGYYNTDEAAKTALELGEQSAQAAEQLGLTAAGMTEFKPFTVTTGLGTATTTPEGGYTLGLSPEQQALQTGALGQAQGFMTGIGQDPMSTLLSGQAQQAFQGLGPSALTGLGTTAYSGLGPSSLRTTGGTGLSAVGGDPMQAEILAQARERFAQIGADPRQQALLSRADTAFETAFGDTGQAQADIYSQLRAAQQPEEERQRLALEERMLAQGRLGLSSSAYGGSSPELLAQAKAIEEARASASLTARQQANKEQQQSYERGLGLLGEASGMRAQELDEAVGLLGAGYTPEQRELARAQAQLSGGLSQEQADLTRAGALFGAGMTQEQTDLARATGLLGSSYMPRTQDLAMATGLMGLGYTPQEQALATMGYGIDLAKIPAASRQAGAELFGQLGGRGLESLMQSLELATGLESVKRTGLSDALLGRQPTLQEQLLGSALGVDVSSDGGLLSSLGFGDAETPSYIKWIGDALGFGGSGESSAPAVDEAYGVDGRDLIPDYGDYNDGSRSY